MIWTQTRRGMGQVFSISRLGQGKAKWNKKHAESHLEPQDPPTGRRPGLRTGCPEGGMLPYRQSLCLLGALETVTWRCLPASCWLAFVKVPARWANAQWAGIHRAKPTGTAGTFVGGTSSVTGNPGCGATPGYQTGRCEPCGQCPGERGLVLPG